MEVDEDMDEDDEEMDEIPPLNPGLVPVIGQPVIPIMPSAMPVAASLPTLLNKPNNDAEEDYDNF